MMTLVAVFRSSLGMLTFYVGFFEYVTGSQSAMAVSKLPFRLPIENQRSGLAGKAKDISPCEGGVVSQSLTSGIILC